MAFHPQSNIFFFVITLALLTFYCEQMPAAFANGATPMIRVGDVELLAETCPAGEYVFYRFGRRECEECPRGSYQDVPNPNTTWASAALAKSRRTGDTQVNRVS